MKTPTVINFILWLAIFLSVTSMSIAQERVVEEGILLEVKGMGNDNVYIYGEPITIEYREKNTTGADIPYFMPMPLTTKKYLINMATQDTMPKRGGSGPMRGFRSDSYRERSYHVRNEKPNPDEYFHADYDGVLFRSINYFYGRERLDGKGERTGRVGNYLFQLYALPVGRYQFVYQYKLLPGRKVMKAVHEFEVLPVPASEKDALHAFTASLVYLSNNNNRASISYSQNHAESLENFVANFPNSVYTGYVYMTMIRFYMATFEPDGLRASEYRRKFESLLTLYPLFENRLNKRDYSVYYPDILYRIDTKGFDSKIDEFLRVLTNDDPLFSELSIRWARDIPGKKETKFRNYAQERVDNENRR